MAFSPSHFLKKGFSSNSRIFLLGSSAGVSSGRPAMRSSSLPSCSYDLIRDSETYDLSGLESLGSVALALGEGLLRELAFFL